MKMNKSIAVFLLVACMFVIFADMSEASPHHRLRHVMNKRCVGPDGVCSFDNGPDQYCCGGMFCSKEAGWAQGRCYYN